MIYLSASRLLPIRKLYNDVRIKSSMHTGISNVMPELRTAFITGVCPCNCAATLSRAYQQLWQFPCTRSIFILRCTIVRSSVSPTAVDIDTYGRSAYHFVFGICRVAHSSGLYIGMDSLRFVRRYTLCSKTSGFLFL